MSDTITTKTEDDFSQELINAMPSGYQTSTGFPLGDFFTAIGMVLKPVWDAIVTIFTMLTDLNNWDLALLKIYCSQRRNIIYKEASYSSGYVTVEGDFSLNVGDQFNTDGGLIFEVQEATADTDGTASVLVKCTTAGIAGNVAANAITKMPVTLDGVTSVTNESAFTNGYNEEGKTAYLQRYFDDLAKPITSANIYHYEKWAKEITGVGNARVVPLWDGDNTVKVVIINSEAQPANSELVATVQEYIDPDISGTGEGQAPCGAYCTVVSATALNVNITANVKYLSNTTKSTVDAEITANIAGYLASIAFNQDYVSYAKIGDTILNSVGVQDYDTLRMNNGTANISISESQIAIVGTTTFTATI